MYAPGPYEKHPLSHPPHQPPSQQWSDEDNSDEDSSASASGDELEDVDAQTPSTVAGPGESFVRGERPDPLALAPPPAQRDRERTRKSSPAETARRRARPYPPPAVRPRLSLGHAGDRDRDRDEDGGADGRGEKGGCDVPECRGCSPGAMGAGTGVPPRLRPAFQDVGGWAVLAEEDSEDG